MYNCFGASSFCVRDSFLQTLHYAFIDTHDKISFEIFGIGLFGECKKNFCRGGGGVLYVLQFLRWASPLCDGQKCANSKCLAFDLLAASGLANCFV